MISTDIAALGDAIVAEFNLGDLITHQWINDRLDLPSIDELKGSTIEHDNDQIMVIKSHEKIAFLRLSKIEQLKSHLLKNHNALLVNTRGVGYYLAKPDDWPSELQKDRRKAESLKQDALLKTHYAPVSKMNDCAKQNLADLQRLLSVEIHFARMAQAKLEEAQGLLKKLGFFKD